MSFYATISGNLVIPKKAEKELRALIPYWEEFIEDNDMDGAVIGVDHNKNTVTYTLDGFYKSLGRDLDIAVFKLLQKFPEVKGHFTIYSTDGTLIFQEYTISAGRLFRAQLGQQREVELAILGARDAEAEPFETILPTDIKVETLVDVKVEPPPV
jgi:hypothetical protein